MYQLQISLYSLRVNHEPPYKRTRTKNKLKPVTYTQLAPPNQRHCYYNGLEWGFTFTIDLYLDRLTHLPKIMFTITLRDQGKPT